MAKLKIVLDHPLEDGMSVTVKTACDCTAVDGLRVYYLEVTEDNSTQTYKDFTFKDVHGNDLTDNGNLFAAESYVKFVLDTTNYYAYPQNADTNAYLEAKFGEYLPLTGGTVTNSITVKKTDTAEAAFCLENSNRIGSFAINPSNNFGIYDNTSKQWVFAHIASTGALLSGYHTPPAVNGFRQSKASTTDITAGSTSLTTGDIYLVYE